MEFKEFAKKLAEQYKKMQTSGTLYIVDVSKEELWNHYLDSFPLEENKVLYENRVYDCNECKKWIKSISNVVSIVNNKLITVWDIKAKGYYKDVAKSMQQLIQSKEIKNKFFIKPNITKNKMVGSIKNTVNESNATLYRDKVGMTFYHLHSEIDKELIKTETPTIQAKIEGKYIGYKRSCEDINLNAVEIVKDLIAGDLYRGTEMLEAVETFETLLKGYEQAENKNIYLWSTIEGPHRKIRGTVIGTLLQDITEGVDIDTAVKEYENKTAPSNYKRTNAIVTPKMKEQALKFIQDEGIEESLYKRYAVLPDVSVNDVLFVDSSVSDKMKDGIAGLMAQNTTFKPDLSKIRTELSIDDFIANIVPKAQSIDILVENKHQGNFVSLIAPKVESAPNIQQWDNNFSWAYKGGVTDSMKERVKAAGGFTEGVLRFSIQWNEDKMDQYNDLDAHCECPQGHIYYGDKMEALDVDIISPEDSIAVENITWATKKDIKEGKYEFYVKNYSGKNTKGFRAEIEMDGIIYEYNYNKAIREKANIQVAKVTLKNGQFTIDHKLPTSKSSKDIWGIKTEQLVKVDSIMYSPNYWNDNSVGNKHTFFMLEGCKNDSSIRGLYNEHLNPKYREIRKSIDMLAPLLQCEKTNEQISGLGFSETLRNEFKVSVRGNDVSGTYLIKV